MTPEELEYLKQCCLDEVAFERARQLVAKVASRSFSGSALSACSAGIISEFAMASWQGVLPEYERFSAPSFNANARSPSAAIAQTQIRYFQALIENATDIIVILDSQGVFSFCSPSSQRILGYALTDVIGKSFAEFVHPDDLPQVFEAFQAAIAHPRVNQPAVTYRVRHQDGSWRVFEAVTTSLLNDPVVGGVVVNCHDITAQHNALSALQTANHHIISLLEGISDAFFSLDTHWHLTYLNQQAGDLLQVNPVEVLGQEIWQVFPAMRNNEFEVNLRRARAEQTSLNFEHYCKSLNRWLEVRVSWVEDGLLVFLLDMSDRHAAEVELLEMSSALGNAVEGIARVDLEGRYVALNRAYAQALGYEAEEMIGMHWEETLHPEDIPIIKTAYQQMLEQGKVVIEARARRKDGFIFYEEIVLVPAHDLHDHVIGHHCFIRDITERRQAERSLSNLYRQVQQLNAELEQQVQERTAQLQQALQHEATLKRITDAVRDSLDEEQILQRAVQELAQALAVEGCDAALYDLEKRTSTICYESLQGMDSAKGEVIQMEDFCHIYDLLLNEQYFQFCQVAPNPIRSLERHHAILACPLVGDQDVMGDLWLFKPREQVFSSLEIRLVQQVANQCAIAIRQARLYQAAQAQVKELEKLNQLKDDFLSTVSHELRTPMSNMKMAIHMLRSVSSPERQQRYLDILQAECMREIELINDLLDLQRLEAASYRIVPEPINLQPFLAQVVEPFYERSRDRQQTLYCCIDPKASAILSDRPTLERILAELLNNACKYTPPGGEIRLEVLSHYGDSDSHQLAFRVSNQAEIPPEELPRIFEKFYRVPATDRWQQGGTGLGLALVQRLIAQLNGKISVTSQSNWTAFVVQLPLILSPQS